MATLRIPITHYSQEEKERRGLGIIVMEETMETSVAKGMALNSEERNQKWGEGGGGLKGRSLFQGPFLRRYPNLLCYLHLPPSQSEPRVKNFGKLGPLSISSPVSLVLQGKSQ